MIFIHIYENTNSMFYGIDRFKNKIEYIYDDEKSYGRSYIKNLHYALKVVPGA